MVRQKPDDVAKEVEAEDDAVYGEEYASAPNPDKIASKGTEEALEDVIGNAPDRTDKGFNIGDEINEDENAIQNKPINDYQAQDDSNKKQSDDPDEDDDAPATQDPLEHLVETEDE